jgi:hypothetical protein
LHRHFRWLWRWFKSFGGSLHLLSLIFSTIGGVFLDVFSLFVISEKLLTFLSYCVEMRPHTRQ